MNAVREWATEAGLPVGERGRISREVFVTFLENNPREARKFLKSKGYEVGTRGRVSKADIQDAVYS